MKTMEDVCQMLVGNNYKVCYKNRDGEDKWIYGKVVNYGDTGLILCSETEVYQIPLTSIYWILPIEKKYLHDKLNTSIGKVKIEDLNNLLECVGVHVSFINNKGIQKLFIKIDEKRIDKIIKTKVGRPVEHEIDFALIEKLKADGKTNKEIYTELGISKSLFYLKMKEYKKSK